MSCSQTVSLYCGIIWANKNDNNNNNNNNNNNDYGSLEDKNNIWNYPCALTLTNKTYVDEINVLSVTSSVRFFSRLSLRVTASGVCLLQLSRSPAARTAFSCVSLVYTLTLSSRHLPSCLSFVIIVINHQLLSSFCGTFGTISRITK